MKHHIGEVVESGTRGFIARSPRVGEAPPFGSFVRTDAGSPVYGLVYDIVTGSKEPGRKPDAYEMSMGELRREQPQIFELLKTEFHVLTLGYLDSGKIRFTLSPLPPPIHSFVYNCTDEEKEALSSEDFFLRSIISSANVPVDDLIISSLLGAQGVRKNDKDYMVRMGKSLSRFLRDDYERLSSILRRLL